MIQMPRLLEATHLLKRDELITRLLITKRPWQFGLTTSSPTMLLAISFLRKVKLTPQFSTPGLLYRSSPKMLTLTRTWRLPSMKKAKYPRQYRNMNRRWRSRRSPLLLRTIWLGYWLPIPMHQSDTVIGRWSWQHAPINFPEAATPPFYTRWPLHMQMQGNSAELLTWGNSPYR